MITRTRVFLFEKCTGEFFCQEGKKPLDISLF